MVKYYKTQIAVCIALLVLPISTCIAINREELSYDYTVDITSDSKQPYILYVPIPLYISTPSRTTPSKIVSQIAVTSGDITFKIVDTIHGRALCIEGSGNGSLQAAGVDIYLFDSMYEGEIISLFDSEDLKERCYWMYNDSSAESIFVRFGYHFRDDQIGSVIEWDYDFAGNLVQGWNSVDVRMSGLIGDKAMPSSLLIWGLLTITIPPAAFVYLLYIRYKHKKDTNGSITEYYQGNL